MAVTRKPGATYQDVLDAPEHQTAEIIDGDLYVSPRPNNRANYMHTKLSYVLHGAFDRGEGGPGGWIVMIEPELHLSGYVLVPDMAGWRRTTLPEMPDGPGVPVVPNWICEVLSPSTAKLDRQRKMQLYARLGVQHAWLLDPARTFLEVYRLHEGHWLLTATHADDEKIRAEPFEAIEIDLARIWSLPSRVGESPAIYAL